MNCYTLPNITKGNVTSRKRKWTELTLKEKEKIINSVKNFYQTLLFAHSRSAIILREAVSKINK